MKKLALLFLLISTNFFGACFRESFNVLNKNNEYIAKKITAACIDESKFGYMMDIYNHNNYSIIIKTYYTNPKLSIRNLKEIKNWKEYFSIPCVLYIKGGEIDKFYILLISPIEGIISSHCGKKYVNKEFFDLIKENTSNIKEIKTILEIIKSDPDNFFGLTMADYYAEKLEYRFEEIDSPCGSFEENFGIKCNELIK